MTLSELALQVRLLAKFIAILFGVIIVFVLLIVILLNLLKKPEPKTVYIDPIFGKLERLVFEKGEKQTGLKFVLDTVNGQLPETTPSANVYYIPESKSTLAYLSQIKNLAESFGFNTEVVEAEPIGESWVKFEDATKGLEVNLKNYHFYFYHKPSETLENLIEATPEAKFTYLEDRFQETAREVLRSRGSYPTYLASGKINLVYQSYDVNDERFYPTPSNQVPQAVRIDFFRKDEDLNVVTPSFVESQNYVILAPLNKDVDLIETKYTSFTKFDDNPGIYPLISSHEAWEKLTGGQAYTVALDKNSKGKIKIKKIDLAYYDPETYQPYFQPIFVFIGDHDYRSYLPAVKQKYLVK